MREKNTGFCAVRYRRFRDLYSGLMIACRPAAATGVVCLLLCACGMGRGRQQSNQEPASGGQQSGEQPATGSQQSPTADQAAASKDAPKPIPPAPADPNKFALLISGVGGEEVYTKKFTAQVFHLYDLLVSRFGFLDKNVTLLTETGASGAEDGFTDPDKTGEAHVALSTADEVHKAFDRLKTATKPDSLVLIVMIGHGSFDNNEPKFNLVGPDLAAKDYAKLLATVPAKRVVFVDCSSSSGEFIKPLSGEGRIVITATRSGSEQNITVFADNFIAALSDEAADTDKNGRLSVLEVFNYAAKLTADWYKEKDQLATEHALIDDNGDGVGHEKAEGGDGALAGITYLDSKPVAEAHGDAELAAMLQKRQQLEESIAKLKANKPNMKPEEYDSELEKLLLDLAKLNQDIKARQKQ
ncbi:MAG TPA: hypothetical protein VI756_14085 [Blastocatellia bacterium]